MGKAPDMKEGSGQAAVWWRVSYGYDIAIKPVAVVKETAATITVVETSYRGKQIECSHRKETQGTQYFRSWDEAHAFALNKSEIALQSARARLERERGAHGNIKGMRMPNVSEQEALLALHSQTD